MVVLTKSKQRSLMHKKYVRGKGKMVVVEGGALPLALLAPLAVSAIASSTPAIINAIKGSDLTPHGGGLRPHGGASDPFSQALVSALQKSAFSTANSPHSKLMSPALRLATMSKMLKRSAGLGLLPHGMTSPYGMGVEGGNLFKKIRSGFKKVGKFLTSKPFKSVVRMVRTGAYPHIRKALPSIVPMLLKATTAIPYVGPALAPITGNPLTSALATKGAEKGVDALNKLAESKGYGISVRDGVKYTKKQLAKTTKGLDKHSLGLLNNMMISAPVKGSGLMPL